MCESCGVVVCCPVTLCVACSVCISVAMGVGCDCICCDRASVGVQGGVMGACVGVCVISDSDGTAAMLVCVLVA